MEADKEAGRSAVPGAAPSALAADGGPALAGPQAAAGHSAPILARERLASLDLVRGFAVLGILAANVVAFGQPLVAGMWPGAFQSEPGPLADWLWVAQFVLVDGKMRGLFTLLFGAGLALFAQRHGARAGAGWLQVRRLLWLLVFGLGHFYLVWPGDILALYALAGLVALPCLGWPVRRQLAVGLGAYAAGAGLYALSLLGSTAEQAAAMEAAARAQAMQEALVMREGGYGDFLARNFGVLGLDPLSGFAANFLETVPLMLIGMALFRLGLFSGRFAARSQRAWGWGGVLTGSALSLAVALGVRAGGYSYVGTAAAFLALAPLPRLAVVIGLAALLSVWAARAPGRLAGRLIAAGRMAFSNYLAMSLGMMLVFHPWAGGLWGMLPRAQLYLVMLLGWALMLGWSAPWLARFRHGPLEWLWRCLVYGRLFPLRQAADRRSAD